MKNYEEETIGVLWILKNINCENINFIKRVIIQVAQKIAICYN